MRHFPGLRKVRQTVFLRCGKLPLGRGTFDASMRRGLWLFLSFGGRVLGHPGIAAEFAMADDANRSMAAPAIDGNRSSAESIYVAGAAGSCRRIRRTTATAGTGAAAIPHAVSSSPISVWRPPMLRCGKQGIKTAANHLTRGDTGRGNSVARATRWPSQGTPIAQRRMWPKIKLCAIVLLGR